MRHYKLSQENIEDIVHCAYGSAWNHLIRLIADYVEELGSSNTLSWKGIKFREYHTRLTDPETGYLRHFLLPEKEIKEDE